MPASIYTRLTREASKSNIDLRTKSNESMTWLENKYSKLNPNNAKPQRFINQAGRKRDAVKVGRMYMFSYDPKTKNDLPYYDRFPLIFAVDFDKDGFYGINLHYLPPVLRAKLFDALWEITGNKDNMNEQTKIQLSYKLLKSATRFRYFKPCFKRYLYGHTKSEFIYVPPEEWAMSLFVPSEQFRKATKEKVWSDSRKMVV